MRHLLTIIFLYMAFLLPEAAYSFKSTKIDSIKPPDKLKKNQQFYEISDGAHKIELKFTGKEKQVRGGKIIKKTEIFYPHLNHKQDSWIDNGLIFFCEMKKKIFDYFPDISNQILSYEGLGKSSGLCKMNFSSVDSSFRNLRLIQRSEEFKEKIFLDFYFERSLNQFTPNDPLYEKQLSIKESGLENVWELFQGNQSGLILVVDNGCDLKHEDLEGQFRENLNLFSDQSPPLFSKNKEGNNHGTACSGIIAAKTNNQTGISGVCPQCNISCVKLLSPDSGEPVATSRDIRTYEHAVEKGAAVVSNSWGFKSAVFIPSGLRIAIEETGKKGRNGKGLLIIFAAGNSNRELASFELYGLKEVFTVGALASSGTREFYSNYGNLLDVVASPESVTTDISGLDGSSSGDYIDNFRGTSASAPIVAGIGGLIASHFPSKSRDEIYQLMRKTASMPETAFVEANGKDNDIGYGEINPVAIFETLLGRSLAEEKERRESIKNTGCGLSTNKEASKPASLILIPLLILIFWAKRRNSIF